MRRKFSMREQVLMVVLALLLLTCVYYILVDRPVQDTILDASIRQGEADSRMTIISARLRKMRGMQAALNELEQSAQSDVPDYDNAKNVVELLNNAMSMSDEYNLTFQPVTRKGAIAMRTVHMEFRCGSYDTGKLILQTLLDSGYRCRITSMSVNGNGSDIRGGGVSVKASVTFYEFVSEGQG